MGREETRPFVDGFFNVVKASCWVDTGASILEITHSVFELIPNSSSLPSFPVLPDWRLNEITGNGLELVGNYQFEVRSYIFSPILCAKSEVILGYDFIRESQLVISCDHIFFHSALNQQENLECSVSMALKDMKIPFRSVLRVHVRVCLARGGSLVPGFFVVMPASKRREKQEDGKNYRKKLPKYLKKTRKTSWSRCRKKARLMDHLTNSSLR